MTIAAKELLPRPPKLKSDGTYDPIELDGWFQRIYLLLGQKGNGSAFNVPNAVGQGTNNATATGSTTSPNGTVDLYINGTLYHLLKASAS